jgi:2-oxoglutarate dehydrogenase E1 component
MQLSAARLGAARLGALGRGLGLGRALSTKPAKKPPPHPYESFLSANSSSYVDEMYAAWRAEPASVHASWQVYFREVEQGARNPFVPPPTLSAGQSLAAAANAPLDYALAPVGAPSSSEHSETMKVVQLVRAFQHRGHNIANLDPLGVYDADLDGSTPPELDLATYGWTDADLDKEFDIGAFMATGFMDTGRPKVPLRKLIERLQQTYAGSIGADYMHIADREQLNWVRTRLETPEPYSFPIDEKLRMLDRLTWGDHFESFLANKFSAVKRFGVEGGESLIPGMKAMIDAATDLGVEAIVMGMPHRGRLNVLANVVRKPFESIFGEFQGKFEKGGDDWSGTGDVKYHLGMSYTRPTLNGRSIHLALVANPSHLEAVNPVVEGKTRAKQHFTGDTDRSRTMSILLHGDAAFSGQGVVFETMGLSDLHHYSTGGTIHIVVNNQIGFTTDPRSSRSSPYCTDVAKAISAPVFHVNGDDVEAVCYVMKLAAEWRQTFHKDVVVDIVCYRRHGHNEIDQPMFTQPLMYKQIAKQPTTWQTYCAQLIKEGSVTQEQVDRLSQSVIDEFTAKLEFSKTHHPKKSEWLSSSWSGMHTPNIFSPVQDTGIDEAQLRKLGTLISTIPLPVSTPHRKIAEVYQQRAKMASTGDGIDWAMGEQLAFASLLAENMHVRISGQDVERGTFSHRHAVVHDQLTGEKAMPLAQVVPDGQAGADPSASFIACNSSLSEFAVLGFELGYSLESPNQLVLWEAQFGDFANTAQCIIDQFISSGEQKWVRQSGLVLLLPHGYDGQGPEHSSARLERFLQMSDDDPDVFPPMEHDHRRQIQEGNWQIVNCTTPANYFHVLRRQTHRDFRKPLIVMSPKNLLRHRQCVSTYADMAPGTRFMRLIADSGEGLAPAEQVRKLVLCSGKIYYELLAERTKRAAEGGAPSDVAIARVEQISPFPFDKVRDQAGKYPNAEVVWCQEEPKNAGAWAYVQPRIETALRATRGLRPSYAGRGPGASVSTGYKDVHDREQARLIDQALR